MELKIFTKLEWLTMILTIFVIVNSITPNVERGQLLADILCLIPVVYIVVMFMVIKKYGNPWGL